MYLAYPVRKIIFLWKLPEVIEERQMKFEREMLDWAEGVNRDLEKWTKQQAEIIQRAVEQIGQS